MATQEIVTYVDDITGVESDDITTVQFGLDGVTYNIDLNEQNAERLRGALAEFIFHARRVGGRLRRGVKPASTNDTDASLVRQWADENGYELAGRGRIPKHVVAAYKEAQASAAVSTGKTTKHGQNNARSRKTPPPAPAFTGNDQSSSTATRRARTTAAKRTKS